MKSINTANRILWIDIYRALAITLVVIGHTTGLFNNYIYQFHLAAFFCISGYVAKQKNITCLEIFLKKFYSIIWTLFMFVLFFAGIMYILYRTGNYTFWLGSLDFIGVGNIIKHFLLSGSIYVWWLGAVWFLVVLFLVILVSKIIYIFACENSAIYLVLSLFIYIAGYYYYHVGGRSLPYYFDLVPIAQFFYCIGFVLKNEIEDILIEVRCSLAWVIVIITTFIMYFLGGIPNIKLDYVARTFYSIGWNTFACINGIIWLWGISQLIVKLRCKQLIDFLQLIGQNTLGILLLHFAFFKVSNLILFFMGVIAQNDIGRFLPEESVGNQYWWMISAISILGSVCVWLLLKNTPVVSRVLGLDSEWYKQKVVMIKSNSRISLYLNRISEMMSQYYTIRKIFSYLLILIAIIMFFFISIKEYKIKKML